MRALIVTASMGAGHTAVARELARRLRLRDVEASVVDVLELAGRDGARLRRTYRLLLDRAPWLYDAAMRFWARHPAPLERFTAAHGAAFDRAVAGAVAAHRPDVVVCTYNLAAQALGRVRPDAAVVTVVVDPGAHPYWVSGGVDLYVAPLPVTARGLRAYGARRVVVAPPVVWPVFRDPPSRAAARARLGSPAGRIALVSAGSWAAGRIRQTVSVLREVPGLTVVVLCGRDEALRASLSGVRAVGWTDQVPAYLAAADVLIDNAGGLTCWEALSSGTPVLCHDPLPGHGRFNATALASSGLVRVTRSARELQAALVNPLAAPPFAPEGPDVADAVLAEVAHAAL